MKGLLNSKTITLFTNAPWAKRSQAHGAFTNGDRLNDNMANKPIQFFLREQKLNIGKQAGKTVIVARPTGRQRVDFRNFCARIAKSTTFNAQEGGSRAEPCQRNRS